MSKNRASDPHGDIGKDSHPRKAEKREIYSIISKLQNGKRYDQKGVSFQSAGLLLVAFLLILLPGSILTQTVSATTGTPSASFSVSSNSGCLPLSVKFTDSSTVSGDTINKWDWDFDGDGTVDGTNITTKPSAFYHAYTKPGTYIAKLTVTAKSSQKSGSTTKTIIVKGSNADFASTQTSGCSPWTVTFTDASIFSSTTPITAWAWDFGDSTTYNGQTPPAHIYSTPGTYTVKLTTTTSCGTNTMTKTGCITVYGPPVADFTSTATIGCAPLTVTFADNSNANGQAITSWTWDFGDTTTYTGQTPPAHIYSSPGTYTVKLTVTTACGSNTMTKTNYITAQGSKADFTASPTSGCSPLTVTFTNAAQAIGSTITKWEWDLNGDGTVERTDTSAPSAFAYIYNTPGAYNVKLTTTTSCGTNTMTKTGYITAYGPPAADFTATTTSGCAPLTVTFTNTSNGNGRTITGWAWDFGDSATYNGQTPPNHIYSTPGAYTVKLTVTSVCGSNTMTKTGYISAYGPPTANFTAIPNSGCPPLTVTFTNRSNGNGRIITGWTWDFGDSTTYIGQTPPAHIYSIRGTYTVRLTVTSACGTDTKTALVTVSQPVVVPGTYGPACVSGVNIALNGSPGGGTWFGDGVSGNIFNPVAAGPGNHVLTYQYTSSSSCSFSNTTTLTVVPLPQTTITVG